MSESEMAGAAMATGDPRVDDLLARLGSLDDLPVAEHVGVFESVLTGLRSTLAGAGEAAPGPGSDAVDPSL